MSKTGLFVGGFFVAGLAVASWQFFQPGSQPASVAPSGAMVPEDTSSVEQGAPIAVVQLPAQLSPKAELGKLAFEAKCAVCHGDNAAGQNGVAPPLVNRIYEPGHHSDEAFVSAAKNGVTSHHWEFGNMPKITGLTRADVLYIARYVRELQRENGIN